MSSLYKQVVDELHKCQDEHSLEGFRDWSGSFSRDIEANPDKSLVGLVHQIEGVLAEASSANWATADILSDLKSIAQASGSVGTSNSNRSWSNSEPFGSNANVPLVVPMKNAA